MSVYQNYPEEATGRFMAAFVVYLPSKPCSLNLLCCSNKDTQDPITSRITLTWEDDPFSFRSYEDYDDVIFQVESNCPIDRHMIPW